MVQSQKIIIMRNKICTLFLALAASAGTIFAQVQIGDLYYFLDVTSQTAQVTYQDYGSPKNYSGLTSINIPASVTYNDVTYSVTRIGYEAFENCSSLTSVTIPNSVTLIDEAAFCECTGLISVDIPNSVTSIRYAAFQGCSSLTSVTIGNSVTNIVNGAFYSCTKLTSVTWNAKNCNGDYFGSQVESFVFGNDVEVIPNRICYGMNKLTSITIPEGVTSIGRSAFIGCTGLTSVTWNAKNCEDFTSNNTPFFFGYSNSEDYFDIRSQITSFTIEKEVEHIPAYLCSGMSSLTTDTIPNSVTSIGEGAFFRCNGLTSLSIGNGVTSIGNKAFDLCTGLSSIEIENGNTIYDSRNNCNAIIETASNTLIVGCMNTIIPSGITNIDKYAFQNCYGLTSMTIPNSVTSIGEGAFSGCSGLTSVTISNGVTNIDNYVFSGCSSLSSIEIPNNVTSIRSAAFSGCSSLTSITIPESVTSIGIKAFENCNSLKSLEFPSSLIYLEEGIFAGCTGLEVIKIPSSILSYGEYRRQQCESGEEIGCDIMEEYFDERYTIAGNLDYNDYNWSIRYPNPLPNLKTVEAPAWFVDVPEEYWVNCPKYLEKVTVNRGELSDDVIGVIKRSYKSLLSLNIFGVSNTSLADEAFNGCYNLETLVLPESLTEIGYMMAAGSVYLQSVVIPAGVTEIGDRAFENCRSMSAVTFAGDALTSIGNWAFFQCLELQELVIPEGVTDIGKAAFYGCTYLKDVTLPESVRSIGDNGFALCSKMTKMQVNAVVPPTIAARTFEDVSREMPVYVPDASVDAYMADPYWSELNIIAGEITAVNAIESTPATASKVLRDGQILILRDGKTYSVHGQEVR